MAPLANTAKRGLLAGSTKLYIAQFVFEGAPDGHNVFDTTEMFETELFPASAGIVNDRVPIFGSVSACNAETLASIDALPPVALTTP